MPTPAACATADTGASGSARNTSRAAARIASSLRAACALRPLSGGLVAVMASLYVNGTLRSRKSLNGVLHSVTVWNRAIHSAQDRRRGHGHTDRRGQEPHP